MKNNKRAWYTLALAVALFSLIALNNLFSQGHQLAKENMLQLSLAFNELDNNLQEFLISRGSEGIKQIQSSKRKFETQLESIQNEGENTSLQFLPENMAKYFKNSGLSNLDFSKINAEWGASQARLNYIINHSKELREFQTSISKTQEKNKVMQDAYKALISFLLENHFSGNKIATVQRQPWMADRVSLRILWLQRPLAFSKENLASLSQESKLFSQSVIPLLDEQLKELAEESEELKAILDKLYPAIKSYASELNNVTKYGAILDKSGMQKIVQSSRLLTLKSSIENESTKLIQSLGRKIFSILASSTLFLIALGLALYSLLNLRSTAKTSTTQNINPVAISTEPVTTPDLAVSKQSIEVDLESSENLFTEEIDDNTSFASSNIDTTAQLQTQLTETQEVEKLEISHEPVIASLENMRSEDEYQALVNQIEALKTQYKKPDTTELLNGLESIINGDLSVELNTQDEDWGPVASNVNVLTLKLKQLVKALKISATQTELLADKRNIFLQNSAFNIEDISYLKQQSDSFISRLEALNLNIKIKINSIAPGEDDAKLLFSDIDKLKASAQLISQNLDILSTTKTDDKQQEKVVMFDNLKSLSQKIYVIASKFKV